jgi:CHAD domain-containing protein
MAVKTDVIPNTNPDIPLSDCLNQISKALFRNTFSFEKGASQGDTDSIHYMRVATIRLHSVLKAFRPCFKKGGFKENFLRVKKLLKSLGRVRKADVFKEILEKYYKDPKAVRRLVFKFSHKRSFAQKRFKVTMVKFNKNDFKKKFYRFTKKPLVFNSTFNIEMPLRASLENILPRTADEMLNNLNNALKSPMLVKELHETRIKAKPLKAISEISVSLFDREFEDCFSEIKKVLSVMGEIHDLDETVINIEKHNKKRWYKRLQPGLEGIKSHRSVLFENLRRINGNLQKNMFPKQISLAMQNKLEIKKGEIK